MVLVVKNPHTQYIYILLLNTANLLIRVLSPVKVRKDCIKEVMLRLRLEGWDCVYTWPGGKNLAERAET